VRALQQLAVTATSFKQNIEEELRSGKNLSAIAKKSSLSAVVTGLFNRRGESDKESDSIKQQRGRRTTPNIPELVVNATFSLAQENFCSEVLPSNSSFYLVVLDKKVPSHQLTFEEVVSKIETFLIQEQAAKLMKEAAYNSLIDLRRLLKEGKSFTAAAASMNCNVEPLSNLSLQEKMPSSLDRTTFFQATLPLQEKELSDVKHASWGDFIIYLEHRTPLSSKDWEEHHGAIEKEFLDQEQNTIFVEWLNRARAEARLKLLHQRSRRR
jgi:hypothetical protein